MKGFSLIEVVVSITIIGILGLLTSTILSRTYRTSVQSDLIGNLKQTGQDITNTIEQEVKNSEVIVCYYPETGSPKKWMVVRTLEGTYNRYRFIDPTSGQNGYAAKQVNLDPLTLNNFCKDPPNLAGEYPLSDRNADTGVSIKNGQFIPYEAGGKDTVTIKFDIDPPANYRGPSGSPVPMQRTVRVRNDTFR